MHKTRVYYILEAFRAAVDGKRYTAELKHTREWVPTDYGTRRPYCTFTLAVYDATGGRCVFTHTCGEDAEDRALRAMLEAKRRELVPDSSVSAVSNLKCWGCRFYHMNWPQLGECCSPQFCHGCAIPLTADACKHYESIIGHAEEGRESYE